MKYSQELRASRCRMVPSLPKTSSKTMFVFRLEIDVSRGSDRRRHRNGQCIHRRLTKPNGVQTASSESWYIWAQILRRWDVNKAVDRQVSGLTSVDKKIGMEMGIQNGRCQREYFGRREQKTIVSLTWRIDKRPDRYDEEESITN